jgi:hypothetical protein
LRKRRRLDALVHVELALALAEHTLALGAHIVARAHDVRADETPVRSVIRLEGG